MPNQSGGLIIAAPERWDEACFAVPAIRAMQKSGLIAGLVCREEQEVFWETVTKSQRFTYSQKTSPRELAKRLGNNWESSLVWDSKVPANAFAKAKIQKRHGPEDSPFAKLLTHPIKIAESPTEHRVRRYLNTAQELGVATDKAEFFTAAALGIPATPNSVLLCPGSDFGPSHEWTLDHWQEVAEALLEQGKNITIVGAVGGRGLGKILAARLGNDAEFFHAAPLAAAIPLLAAHQLIISADGSLPHLAAHAGSTCVTLFGPNDAVWKRPLGKRHVTVKKHVECAPCLSSKCIMDRRCQNELEVARVLKAIPPGF